ncbi:MAG: type II toxin-antitoxin system RelE/ParE family toxin [Anaerolineales bacterium]|nr:MAG: type II toxin-antitoxin system RelE/ParE family toxin [Anaerolineales bacterium]
MSRYTVYIIPHAWKEIKDLPGNMRQRVKRAIDALADDPRPPRSKALDAPEFEQELRRLRLDRWRIVYAVTEADKAVDVLAVRKRPPYDYGDLGPLLAEVS